MNYSMGRKMNIISKCRCGSSIDVTAGEIYASRQFKEWLVLHNECPNKMFSSHIAFKYLLRKTQYK